jgi:hypothetical protein
MTLYDRTEIELKMLLDSSADMHSLLESVVGRYFSIEKGNTKSVVDTYYDTQDDCLYKNLMSFRTRESSSNPKNIHLNLKLPYDYNSDGIISRRELSCRDKTSNLSNMLGEVISNDEITILSMLRIALQKKCSDFPLHKRLVVRTIREKFAIKELYFNSFNEQLIIGIACIDHSLCENQSFAQFEIELLNSCMNPTHFEILRSISHQFQHSGLKIQTKSKYQQLLEHCLD